MFKWPGAPSPRAPEHELADFAELICWQQGNTSMTALSQSLGRLDENDYSDGVPEEEDTSNDVEGAFSEIEKRAEACRGGYPFKIDDIGNSLHTARNIDSSKHIIYRYLLLATRMNMNDNRVHADTDGTLLFEKLASETSREYLGDRAESIVFGTADGASDFMGKVDDLCRKLREGGKSRNSDGSRRQKDAKLDVVAWKPFTDQREGKLIAFGQCKTGTNWKGQVTQLQPDAFCSNWFESQPALTPIRMFFISEALSSVGWRNNAVNAGLLFDRCRIVDFSSEVSEQLLDQIAVWTDAAAKATGLPGCLDFLQS